MSAPTMPSLLPSAARSLLSAARRGLDGDARRSVSSNAPTLHDYRVRGLEAAERLRDRPRPR